MVALARFIKDDSGSVIVEYGSIAVFISVVILTSMRLIFGNADNAFGKLVSLWPF